MHLADRILLPPPYTARPYRGRADHPEMTSVLAGYREQKGDPELPTVEQLDVTYGNLQNCDPDTDIAIVGHADEVVGYVRASWEDLERGVRHCVLFAPMRRDVVDRSLYTALAVAQEAHMLPRADAASSARFRSYASHPGPGEPAQGEAEWLEALGYEATEWEASLVRPNLENIPERRLPDGVDVRPVTEDQVRPILEAHLEAFRGEWDFREPTEADVVEMMDDPNLDETLWKIAWAGDVVVGQVKSFINPDENAQRGYRRGYTEYISTHPAWRNRGIAGALLSMSLHELEERGMTEAALGVDTNNPGGAFQLYTGLGFELRNYLAVYTKMIH